MIIIQIGKRIRLQKSGIDGFRIFIKIKIKNKDKWYCFKLTNKEIKLLDFMLRSQLK